MPSFRSVLLAFALLLPTAASAQEFDDDIFDDGDDDDAEEEKVERIDDSDDLKVDDPGPTGDEDWVENLGEERREIDTEDLPDEGVYDEDSEVAVSGPGQDSSRLYREQLDKVNDLSPDEEALAWERYLKKYPNTMFRSRIDARLDTLSQELYEGRIETEDERFKDAGKTELKFAQPMQLESIDPRSRIRAGFEMGLPSYLNLLLGAEYQLKREWSVTGFIRSRYTGLNLEAGTRYALVKSARTNTLVTGLADLHVNMNPMHFGFRPQVGVGQRIQLKGDTYIDAQLQGGTDLLFLTQDSGDGTLSPRLVGGANITLVPNKTVRAYFETSSYMKGMFDDTVPSFFRFNIVTFGIKFVQRKSATKDRSEVGIGASAPYSSYYWGYHYGAIMADYNMYLDG